MKEGVKIKKTHQEYIEELSKKNPNLEAIEEYVDAKTKIMHRCKTHNIKWEVLPSNALAGKGCKECMKEKLKNRFVKKHDEYVSQVEKINPNIVVIDDYINTKTPIMHLCKTHNVKWMAFPSNILKGQGCVECGKEKAHEKNSKKHDEYVTELALKNPIIEVTEKYINAKTKIKHHCLIHDEYWDVAPTDVLSGHGCKKCRAEKVRNALTKNHDDYIKELFEKNLPVVPIEKYVGAKVKIKHRCLKHNIIWEIAPSHILKGCGCPKCLSEKISQANSLTNDEYTRLLQEKNQNVVALEKYVDTKTQILHKCVVHNYEWKTTPASMLQGCGCPKCRGEKISEKLSKTHDEYVKELKGINSHIIVIGQYINSFVPILHKCLLDDNEWYATPANILFGTGCPKCNASKGEQAIQQWLDSNCIEYICQKSFKDCKDIKPLPFDFYIPNQNLCIEYDGIQHFEPIEFFGGQESFEITVKHDEIKNEYCKNNGISLLRIPYFKNVEEELNNFLFI